MNSGCRGICNTTDFKKKYITTRKHANAFKLGYHRCRNCQYYVMNFIYCPCCLTKLASVPRNSRCKRILNADIGRY